MAVGQQGFMDHIHATPAISGCGCLGNVPTHSDIALIWVEDKRGTKQQKVLLWKVSFTWYSTFYFTNLNISSSLAFTRAPCGTSPTDFCHSRLLARMWFPDSKIPCMRRVVQSLSYSQLWLPTILRHSLEPQQQSCNWDSTFRLNRFQLLSHTQIWDTFSSGEVDKRRFTWTV